MKITLFLNSKVVDFFLPSEVAGSYSFDANPNEDTKLINVEERNGVWTLYTTPEISIVIDKSPVNEYVLNEERFVVLVREDKSYLIYICPTQEQELSTFSYMPQSRFIIGNTPDCNVKINSSLLDGIITRIEYQGTQLVVTTNSSTFLYANKKHIESGYVVKVGDTIQLLNFKIQFLKNLLIVNNPAKSVEINTVSSNILPYQFPEEKLENKETKEVELYSKKDYFSKSPRIRRVVEHKDFKLDNAPENKNDKDNIPLIITLGPMLSMGATSSMSLLNTIIQINNGQTDIKSQWVSLVSGITMLLTSLVWPMLTSAYNKHLEKKKKIELYKKYGDYLVTKKVELEKEKSLQMGIISENLISLDECIKNISTKTNGLWDKRKDQDDFLEARVGIGTVPFDVHIEYPESGFSLDQTELRNVTDQMVEEYKNLENVPIGYSFFDNYMTAIMGVNDKALSFVDNVLLQFMTFYCYDELKIMIFTDEEHADHWKYVKFSNYCFDDNKNIRYFAGSQEEAKELSEALVNELNYRIQIAAENNIKNVNPYYIIICENYSLLKKMTFFKTLTECNYNAGYSILFLNSNLNTLPSKCSNFINISDGTSGILKNSYESQEAINFVDEVNRNIDMMEITRILANIPIEIAGVSNQLPNAIAFLEMEKVGKVEQLNVINRWNNNDSVQSLKAEVGVDEDGNYLYLDIHEKFHGPHGLVAGMTGSGKSEFIITYILSLAMNYSPDDVAFILIDYKGGGLAGAFENKQTGVKLPHLAGTITNLDKAEMSRTLVSIDSEVKKRQAMFNVARDSLGESTIDIYKYQKFFHEGKLKDPIPHLLIISDEFAELKSQQPEFMDNLISVARIGRSLGVHLILATQKPSGVVDDQIWSNTKFRVCLKVQDASDSNEMLKRPDAASLKQTGRFFLQVGYDEYFALGQSGWCGAKYFPSDKIVKQIDKSINFISNNGQVIKSIQDSQKNNKTEAQGEQLAAVMNEVINAAKQQNKYARSLWLDNIPEIITIENTEKKYNLTHEPYNIKFTIGEYDAPELQEQGQVVYNLLDDGNTLVYGLEGSEREKLLLAMIMSGVSHHKTEELNYYIMDYGSESLRAIMQFPQIGGMVFTGEDERYYNLLKLIREERDRRKKELVEYGGEFKNFLKNSPTKKPIIVVMINNFDTLCENNENVIEELPDLLRDSERYGIVFIITANSERSISSRIGSNFKNLIVLHLKDTADYTTVFPIRTKLVPRDMFGRGLFVDGEVIHEFQTASLVEEQDKQNDYINQVLEKIKAENPTRAKDIPTLPEHIKLEHIQEGLKDLSCLPVGIAKNNLEIISLNMEAQLGSLVSSNKVNNCVEFAKSMIQELKNMKSIGCILIDSQSLLEDQKDMVSNYYNEGFDEVMDKITGYIDKKIEVGAPEHSNMVLMIFGIYKMLSKLEESYKYEDLINKIKSYEKMSVIIFEDQNKLKDYTYETWFSIFSVDTGVWVGKGMGDQTLFKYSNFSKEMNGEYKNDMGYYIEEGTATLMKLIDFNAKEDDVKNE